MEEGNGIDNLHRATGAGGAAEEDGVDGGSSVLKGVQDQLYIGILVDLIPRFASHDSLSSNLSPSDPQIGAAVAVAVGLYGNDVSVVFSLV